MEPPRLRCLLVTPDGLSRRVGPGGLLIGRQRDCDIVAADPALSRRHALIRLTADGVELVPLGKTPIELNGKPCPGARELADADELRLPGLTLTVCVAAVRPDPQGAAIYRLVRPEGGSFGIVHSPFFIGGDPSDDLIVTAWPAHALRLHAVQGQLFVEVLAGEAGRNRVALSAGALEPLAAGDELAYRGKRFRVETADGYDVTTAVGGARALPLAVSIELLPRGGLVRFSFHGGTRTVHLADRRLDLLIALLRPPAGHQPGDFIPDDVLRQVVWPRNPTVSRPEINTLISRCRRDLLAAGLAGPSLLERAPGGGGTRMQLAPGAAVTMDA
jgi:hypothetical protein